MELTTDQANALEAFPYFLTSDRTFFVIEGESGSGKSTLLSQMIKKLKSYNKARKLVSPDCWDFEFKFTALTHKAAEVVAEVVEEECVTLFSFLGFTLSQGQPVLKRDVDASSTTVLVVDEASMMDFQLFSRLEAVAKRTGMKVIIIGDPYQLTAVKSKFNVFRKMANYPGAEVHRLREIVRQENGSPIIELSRLFKNVLDGQDFDHYNPDQLIVQHVPEEQFLQMAIADFTAGNRSKVLAYRNQTVQEYNLAIHKALANRTLFAPGDYVTANHFSHTYGISNNASLIVSSSRPDQLVYSVKDGQLVIDGQRVFIKDKEIFVPDNYAKACKLLNKHDLSTEQLMDLRYQYACTVNKSQGSTYDTVFIDVNDIATCTSGETIARLMYVAVSRARHRVVLTGDFA